MPCPVTFAREIGTIDAMLNVFLTCAAPEAASAAASVYGVGFTSAALEFLDRYATETGGKLVDSACSAHGN
ncbi:MAG TPA: hypothetical protein VHO84_02325 [Syntrophorhabdaceae bacterium]|nr:hypothetical protein [Syntrophorhabdaceae bacterium]